MADQSLDDALEDVRADKLQHNVDQEILPEDNERPASPATDNREGRPPDDHPTRDTDQDPFEEYQDG